MMEQPPVIETSLEPEPGPEPDGQPIMDPARTLAVLRVLWGVLLIGQIVLAIIAAVIMGSASKVLMDQDTAWQVFGVNSALLVLNILLGSYIRNQVYKRHWQGSIVKPAGYFFGNILMFALLESVVLLAIVLCMLRLSFWPWMLPGLVALLVYLVNFPHGGPMFPATDDATKTEIAS